MAPSKGDPSTQPQALPSAALSDMAAAMLEGMADALLCVDAEKRIRHFNPAAERLFGYPAGEVLGQPLERLIPAADRDAHRQRVAGFLEHGETLHWMGGGLAVQATTRDGHHFPVAILLRRIDSDDGPMAAAMVRDLSGQQTAAADHRRTLEAVSAAHRALVRSDDEQSLLAEICRIAVAVGGYRFAWVGYTEDDPQTTVRPQAFAGHEAGYLDRIRVSWGGDDATGQGPVGRAIRSRAPALERHLRQSTTFKPWRGPALERGYESCIALPLINGEAAFGALAIYAGEADAFGDEEAWLLERLAGDLAYGLQVLRDRRRWHQERERLVAILEATPDFVGIADRQGNVLYRNAGAWRLLGLPPEDDPCRYAINDTQPAWAAQRIHQEAFPTAEREGSWQGELAFTRADGTEVPVSQIIIAHPGDDGEVTHFSTIARDISDQKHTQSEMDKLSGALKQSGDMVWITDDRGVIEYVNPAFERVTGYSAADALGRPTSELLNSGLHSADFYDRLWATIRRGEVFRDIFTNRNRDGELFQLDETISPLRDADGVIRNFVATGRDITENLRMEEQIRFLAYYDPLTELPNRHLFDERLRQATAHLDRHHRIAAVVLVDLDRFKQINDSLGHQTGDRVLLAVGQRFATAVREGDTVARFGNDQFAFLLDDLGSPSQVPGLVTKILEALAEPITIDGFELVVTANAGASLYPGDARDSESLLKQADTALHRAKARGRNQFVAFTPELDQRGPEHLGLEAELNRALERDQFFLVYQPQYHLGAGRLHGVEALLRWQHPDRGVIPPATFIPMLEELGLIEAVGDWALRTAAGQARAWADDGWPLAVAVNLSVQQFRDRQLGDRVAAIAGDAGLAPGQLELEITENLFLEEGDGVARTLAQLQEAGIRLALDDFGTGYSALGYLRRFPVNALKIDRAFIAEVTEQQPAELVRAMVNMARPLGIEPIAEGVEHAGQARALRAMGCELMQGFGLSRPVTADAIPRLAAAGVPTPPEQA